MFVRLKDDAVWLVPSHSSNGKCGENGRDVSSDMQV
jgi:hypothetical protein